MKISYGEFSLQNEKESMEFKKPWSPQKLAFQWIERQPSADRYCNKYPVSGWADATFIASSTVGLQFTAYKKLEKESAITHQLQEVSDTS